MEEGLPCLARSNERTPRSDRRTAARAGMSSPATQVTEVQSFQSTKIFTNYFRWGHCHQRYPAAVASAWQSRQAVVGPVARLSGCHRVSSRLQRSPTHRSLLAPPPSRKRVVVVVGWTAVVVVSVGTERVWEKRLLTTLTTITRAEMSI